MRDLRSFVLLFKHPFDLIVGGSRRKCVEGVRGKWSCVCIVGVEELKCVQIHFVLYCSFRGYFIEECRITRICSISDIWKKEILAIIVYNCS
jgi:hypothetical protein